MKKSTNRALESFLIVTFPVALFAGCAAESNKQPEAGYGLAMNDVPAYTVTETDMDAAAPFTKAAHLFIDTHKLQPDIKTKDHNTETETPTSDQPRANASNDQTGHLLEVNIRQMESDAMITARKPDLDRISFAVNTTEFDAAYLTALQEHAEFLRVNPALTLTVSGHTDSSGSVKYNRALSERRALNVYYILLSYGAPEAQLIIDAYGESTPLNDASNHAENRRVELEYSDSLVLSAR